ncbi:MAG TPA: cation diffusion facilitator family transporter [Acidimicrobiia bacterium]|nr:cation diffusion facilitator family transporter [Acidimicrobiia bacterium]
MSGSHGDGHSDGHGGSARAIAAAFLANLGIALAKFVAFAVTGAASLLAEAVHSVADTGNQGLLFLGGRRSRKPPTREHPFGYGRERYFWSFVVAVVLFTGGGLFALLEGVEKLRHPHELESWQWAVGTLLVAIVLEALSLRTAVQESQAVRGALPWSGFIRHAKVPELPVVLLEDTGALLGLVFALVGVGLAEITGNPRFDALGSIAIGLLLGFIAFVLAVEMKSLLIGEAATPDVQRRICDALERTPGVGRLIHLRTEHLAPDDLLVVAKIAVDPGMTAAETAALIDRAEANVRGQVPEARLMFLEPDIDRRMPARERGGST